MTGICAYCGSTEIVVSHGDVEWCGSDRCQQLHDNATYEPSFRLFLSATPTQQLGAWILYQALRPVCACIPIDWLIRDEYDGWRRDLAARIHSKSYCLYERAKGRL